MLTIVTGSIDSGKTSYIERWFNNKREGFGVLTKKVFQEQVFIGYDHFLLSNNYSYPCIFFKNTKMNPSPTEYYFQGRFLFNKKSMELTNKYLFETLKSSSVLPIYIDEIGALELKGIGFDPFLKKVITSDRDIIISTKEKLIADIAHHYSVKSYNVINLDERNQRDPVSR